MSLLSRTAVGLACLAVACGSGHDGATPKPDSGGYIVPPTEAGPDSGGQGGQGGQQDAAPESSGPFAPAPHDPAPQVESSGGRVLEHPVVVPVFFPGDPYQSGLEQFLKDLAKSSYWGATTAEYGVGKLTIAPTIMATSTPPTTSYEVDQFVSKLVSTYGAGTSATGDGGFLDAGVGDGGFLDGASGDGGFLDAAAGDAGADAGIPSGDRLYTVFLPPGVTVTDNQLGESCKQYGGYHSQTSFLVGSGPGVAYALIPRCPLFNNVTGIDSVTTTTSHELIEASTDPFPYSDPAYAFVDDDHAIWNQVPIGEIGDMCVDEPQSYGNLVGNRVVQRVWSNKAAAAGHNPCVPSANQPYYNAVPDQPDDLLLHQGAFSTQTRGVKLAVGQTRTIDVHLFSDAPRAQWFVQAQDASAFTGGSPTLSLSLDRQYGNNGDILKLTITRVSTGIGGGSEFVIWSRDQQSHTANVWFGYVGD